MNDKGYNVIFWGWGDNSDVYHWIKRFDTLEEANSAVDKSDNKDYLTITDCRDGQVIREATKDWFEGQDEDYNYVPEL